MINAKCVGNNVDQAATCYFKVACIYIKRSLWESCRRMLYTSYIAIIADRDLNQEPRSSDPYITTTLESLLRFESG